MPVPGVKVLGLAGTGMDGLEDSPVEDMETCREVGKEEMHAAAARQKALHDAFGQILRSKVCITCYQRVFIDPIHVHVPDHAADTFQCLFAPERCSSCCDNACMKPHVRTCKQRHCSMLALTAIHVGDAADT